MRFKILLLFIWFAVLVCGRKENLVFKRTDLVEAKLKSHIRENLNKYNDLKDSSDFSIWIVPISPSRNGCALCNFGQYSSHASRKNFFIFCHAQIEILHGSELNQISRVTEFFVDNDFTTTEKDSCISHVIRIFKEDTSVTF